MSFFGTDLGKEKTFTLNYTGEKRFEGNAEQLRCLTD